MARDNKEILKECEAFLEGHFLLSSGRHSGAYCQMAFSAAVPRQVCRSDGHRGGKAEGCGRGCHCRTCHGRHRLCLRAGPPAGQARHLHRAGGQRHDLKRFALHPGEKCIIAEDVVTTGISSLETKKVIEAAGCECLGIVCVVDRTRAEAPSPIPILASALKLDLPNYLPEECPICKEGKLPLVHLGSRKMKEQAKQTL